LLGNHGGMTPNMEGRKARDGQKAQRAPSPASVKDNGHIGLGGTGTIPGRGGKKFGSDVNFKGQSLRGDGGESRLLPTKRDERSVLRIKNIHKKKREKRDY